jgi:uncharacterized protein
MREYCQSRYNVLIPLRNGRVLAYNSMSGATAVWEREDAEAFAEIGDTGQCGSQRIRSSLLYGGFIVPARLNELRVVHDRYVSQRFDPSQMILTIAPTLMCNFGCDYCFQGCNKPTGKMSAVVQDATVAFVALAARSIKHLGIAWYGGEPLLALDVIEELSVRLIALSAERGLKYDASIVTNGYRLDARVAEKLHALKVSLAQITLDGAESDHDQRRTMLGGQPTFKRIVANLRSVVEAVPLKLSVRVNIDSRNRSAITALLDRLADHGFGRRENFSVYFAPVEAITEGCHNVAQLCMSKSEYGELETELTRHAYERGLTSLPYPPRFRGICAAIRPKGFVVAPSGDLHKCWDTISMPSQRVGTVFDLRSLDHDERVMKWVRWTPFAHSSCLNCKILPNCAGSCAHKFVNPEQMRGEGASLPCPSWKYNINERLVLMAQQRGELTTEDYDPNTIRTDPSQLCVARFEEDRFEEEVAL